MIFIHRARRRGAYVFKLIDSADNSAIIGAGNFYARKENHMPVILKTALLLMISNIFMTFAWYVAAG